MTKHPAALLSAAGGQQADDGQLVEHDLLELFLLRYDRARTRRAYRQDLVDFFAFFYELEFGAERVTLEMARGISFVEVNQYLAHLEARDLKAATRRRKLSAIRSFFALLVSLKALETNPAAREVVRRIPKVSSDETPIIVLTKAQARHLVEAASQYLETDTSPPVTARRDEALLLVMIHGCLRRSEVAAVDAGHVRPVGAYWVLDLPHTKGGERQWVKLHARVVDAIERMKAHSAEQFGWTFEPGSSLFRSLSRRNHGARLRSDGIYRIVRRLARRAGLEAEIGAHTLRHTGCTLAIEGGASLQQVQAHARHKDLSTTMRYVHQRDRLRDSAADHISF